MGGGVGEQDDVPDESDLIGREPHRRLAGAYGGHLATLVQLIELRDSNARLKERQGQALSKLSQLLGFPTPLVTRDSVGGHWVLTSTGRHLAESARRIMHEIDSVVEEVRSNDSDPWRPGTISLGCFNAVAKTYVAHALGDLNRNQPDFTALVRLNQDMNIRTVSWELFVKELTTAKLDYACIPWIGTPSVTSLTHLPLYRWTVCAVFPKDHPLESADAVTTAQILDECEHTKYPLPLLLSPWPNVTRVLLNRVFRTTRRYPSAAYVIENPDSATRYHLAREGQGIAIVASDSVPPAINGARWRHPRVVDDRGRAADELYTLSWRTDPGRIDDPHPLLCPPAGVDAGDHKIFARSIVGSVEGFVGACPWVTLADVSMFSSSNIPPAQDGAARS